MAFLSLLFPNMIVSYIIPPAKGDVFLAHGRREQVSCFLITSSNARCGGRKPRHYQEHRAFLFVLLSLGGRHMTKSSASSSGTPGHEGYVLPAENAAEMARLMLLDHLLTQAVGGPLPEQSDLSF